MPFGFLLLILFGAYAAIKFYRTEKQIAVELKNKTVNPPGVSYYCNLAVTQRPAQVLAPQDTNSCATSTGFAPAFGPTENMPNSGNELFW